MEKGLSSVLLFKQVIFLFNCKVKILVLQAQTFDIASQNDSSKFCPLCYERINSPCIQISAEHKQYSQPFSIAKNAIFQLIFCKRITLHLDILQREVHHSNTEVFSRAWKLNLWIYAPLQTHCSLLLRTVFHLQFHSDITAQSHSISASFSTINLPHRFSNVNQMLLQLQLHRYHTTCVYCWVPPPHLPDTTHCRSQKAGADFSMRYYSRKADSRFRRLKMQIRCHKFTLILRML